MTRLSLPSDGCLAAPGAYDALSARLAVNAGAQAIYLGGNAIGLGLGKAQPFVTLSETVDAARRVRAAVDVPLIVDMGAGFGDPAHVRVAVREIEAAGVAAIHIDDQPYPKPPGYHRGRGGLAGVDTMVARLRVAAAARRDPHTTLIARTDALRVTGDLDEAIARGRAFMQAGAQALMILDLKPEQVGRVRQTLPDTPLVWIGGVAAPIPGVQALGAAGFAMALYPFNAVAEVTTRLNDLWRGFFETGAPPQSDERLARARAETVEAADLPAAWAVEDQHDH